MLNIGVYTCIKNYIKIFINSRNNLDSSTCPYGQPAPISPNCLIDSSIIYSLYSGI